MNRLDQSTSAPTVKPLVRFYVYPREVSENQRLDFVCLLAEKAQSAHKRMAILCADETQARNLDERLWAYKKDSFIPHCFSDDALADKALVILSVVPERLVRTDVVINLSLEHKIDLPRGCERVFEIVNQTPEVLRATRERFQAYKRLDLAPQTHALSMAQ